MPTKALFEAVADILRTQKQDTIHEMRMSRSRVLKEEDVEDLFLSLTVAFATEFHRRNPRFNDDKFRRATGVKL